MDNKINMAERITRVETEVKAIKERNSDEHTALGKLVTDMSNKMDRWMETAPSKFASKRTETVMYLVIGSIITGFIAKIMDII